MVKDLVREVAERAVREACEKCAATETCEKLVPDFNQLSSEVGHLKHLNQDISDLKHLIQEVRDLKDTQAAFQLTQVALSKALERLSFVVVGDKEVPNYQSLASKVDVLDKARQTQEIEQVRSHAKLAGIWATVAMVVVPLATLLAKFAWHVDLSFLDPK